MTVASPRFFHRNERTFPMRSIRIDLSIVYLVVAGGMLVMSASIASAAPFSREICTYQTQRISELIKSDLNAGQLHPQTLPDINANIQVIWENCHQGSLAIARRGLNYLQYQYGYHVQSRQIGAR